MSKSPVAVRPTASSVGSVRPRRLVFLVEFAVALLVGLTLALLGQPGAFLDPVQPFRGPTPFNLTAGHLAIQRFVGVSDGLDRLDLFVADVDCSDQTRLAMRLLDAGSGAELARSDAPCASLAPGAYHAFPFPPIADSAGRDFEIELQLTPVTPGASVLLGQLGWSLDPRASSWLDGRPEGGELTFQTSYDGPLLAVALDRLTLGKPGFWGVPALYVALGLLWLGGVGALLFLLVRDEWPRRARWFGAAVVGFALIQGLTYLALVPPWQVPDEPQHFAYIRSLWLPSRPTADAAASQPEAEILASMARFRWYQINALAPPDQPPRQFDDFPFFRLSAAPQDRRPATYYVLSALALRLSGETNLEGQLYLLRVLGVLGGVAGVALAYLAIRVVFPWDERLQLIVPTVVTLIPQRAFLASGVNNDNLAIFAASLAFLASAWLLVRKPSGRGFAALAVGCLFAVLSKATALPAVIGAVAVAIGSGLAAIARRWSWRAAALVAAVGLALIVVGLGKMFEPCDALYWSGNAPMACIRVPSEVPESPFGSYALRVLDDSTTMHETVYQEVPPDVVRTLRGKTVTVGAWVKTPAPLQESYIQLYDGNGLQTFAFLATSKWRFVSQTMRVPPDAARLQVILSGSSWQTEATGQVLYGGVTLVEGDWVTKGAPRRVDDARVDWNGRLLADAVRDGNGARGDYELRPGVAKVLQPLGITVPFDALAVLADPGSYRPAVIQAYKSYTSVLVDSFWGQFGWMNLTLSDTWYEVLQALTILAVAGAAWRVSFRGKKGDAGHALAKPGRRYIILCLLVVLSGFAMAFLREIPPFGQSQGRYALPVVVPFAALLYLGLETITPRVLRRWLPTGVLAFLAVLNVVSLVLVIAARSYFPSVG